MIAYPFSTLSSKQRGVLQTTTLIDAFKSMSFQAPIDEKEASNCT